MRLSGVPWARRAGRGRCRHTRHRWNRGQASRRGHAAAAYRSHFDRKPPETSSLSLFCSENITVDEAWPRASQFEQPFGGGAGREIPKIPHNSKTGKAHLKTIGKRHSKYRNVIKAGGPHEIAGLPSQLRTV